MKFVIEKGKHYSSWFPRLVWGNKLSYKNITIGHSYDFRESEVFNEYQPVHKLIGLSDNWHHHKDSVRIGWRTTEDRGIALYLITYKKGKRGIDFLCNVGYSNISRNPFKPELLTLPFNVAIRIYKSYYEVQVFIKNHDKGNSYYMKISRESSWWGPRLLLKPYYGGTQVSPGEITFTSNK